MSKDKESPEMTRTGKSPLRHFVLLERAREASDFQAALDAQQQLKRLGVVVTYVPPEPATA